MAAVMFMLLLSSACAVPLAIPLPVPPPPEPTAPAVGEYASLADEVVAESNRVRVAEGLMPMRGHAALHRAAQDYALELAARRLLGHTSPTPGRRTMAERIVAAGARYTRAGENLVKLNGQAEHVAEDAVYLWMVSEGHRRNLLGPAFTHTGVGVALGGDGNWYVVQLYMLPAGSAP